MFHQLPLKLNSNGMPARTLPVTNGISTKAALPKIQVLPLLFLPEHLYQVILSIPQPTLPGGRLEALKPVPLPEIGLMLQVLPLLLVPCPNPARFPWFHRRTTLQMLTAIRLSTGRIPQTPQTTESTSLRQLLPTGNGIVRPTAQHLR